MYKKIVIEALSDNLYKVMDKITEELNFIGCNESDKRKICLGLEEIFINIAKYAYPNSTGIVEVKYKFDLSSEIFEVIFIDEGVKYNPLLKQDPDINLAVSDRQIGGLGIYLCKKVLDNIEYSYKQKRNVLRINKKLTI